MMKDILYLISIVVLWTGSFAPGSAQVRLSEEIRSLFEEAELEYYAPVESFFKNAFVEKNEYLPYHFAVKANQVDLEIRYVIQPLKGDISDDYPQVSSMAAASSVASNNIDEEIIVRPLDSETLLEKYNADWGALIELVPKRNFSEAEHCTMLALHKGGKANVYILFLYDLPSKFLQDQLTNLRFRE